ncbi:phage tail tape measure protein [Lactiplantibacillus plantarum]|uniref:phage tail tape measure protein n=1 Tax=Lactiplantibacillus plantarum TaxID=1590 RepID=UPI001EEE13AE|nr:phage tail tape measure protein [Lactiplantibacillus plantarum]
MAQVTATFTANISGYVAAMSQMNSSTRSMQSGISGLSGRVSQGMSTIGKVTTAAGAATTAMGVSALKSYGTFQQSLNKAAIIAGGTSKDIGELADMANKMGAELPLSAQDAADAMVSMAQDGASIKTITKEFPAIAEAATATGADLQTTAGTVQQAMNVWGKSLKSPAQAAAILTQTANLSNASIEDMSGAISNIGGIASQAGFSMGSMTEAVGLLTNKGFTAQRASQDLAHAIIQMEAPSDKAAGEMKKLGLSFTDAQGNMKSFPTILKEVAAATDGMSAAQKTAALKTMFNTAGMQAMLPLLSSIKDESGNTATSWSAYAKAQDGASSSTATATKFLQDQANEMQQNIGSKIEQIGGNWESLRNKSLAAKGGVNSAMVDMINQTITWATDSNSSIAQVARSFIGLSPVIGPAVTATGAFITSAGKIVGVASGAAKGLFNMGKSIIGIPGKLLGIGSASKKQLPKLLHH